MKTIRVQILGREYALRVREEDEAHTREIAQFVNERMRTFQESHPEQGELTAAVITALTLAEELYDERQMQNATCNALSGEINTLAETLRAAIEPDSASDSDDGEATE